MCLDLRIIRYLVRIILRPFPISSDDEAKETLGKVLVVVLKQTQSVIPHSPLPICEVFLTEWPEGRYGLSSLALHLSI